MAEPISLLEPPPPLGGQIVSMPVEARRWFRVHSYDLETGKYKGHVFNNSGMGDGRFSPLIDPEGGKVVATLYAASSVYSAIAEIVLRNIPTPSFGYLHDLAGDLERNLHVSEIQAASVNLANLTSTGMQAAGLKTYALLELNRDQYHQTRAWAQWIWENHKRIQGLAWMSRRYSQDMVIMLFEDRCDPSTVQTIQTAPLRHYETEIITLLTQMGAGVMLP